MITTEVPETVKENIVRFEKAQTDLRSVRQKYEPNTGKPKGQN
jgi:hypothetical protein